MVIFMKSGSSLNLVSFAEKAEAFRMAISISSQSITFTILVQQQQSNNRNAIMNQMMIQRKNQQQTG